MSFFGTLRRVRKGKQPTQHDLLGVRKNLNGKLSSCTSSPNLGLILEQPGCEISASSNTATQADAGVLAVASDNQSLSSSSRDYDEDSLSMAESLETSSSVSIDRGSSFGGSAGRRHKSFTFRQENATKFVAHTSELVSTLPRRNRIKGSTPALNNYAHEDSSDDHSGFLSVRRFHSNEDYQNDAVSVSSGSSVFSLTPKSDEERRREANMINGVKKFNWNPIKGIEFFQSHELIGKEAVDVARLLKNCETLSKNAIGTYLGEPDEFCQEVLHAFVTLHDFTEEHLVESMRRFLASFRLPGEAQKIDRIMEAFAHHYCDQNPTVFSNTDACYLLSYAIIMLNTTLHNPSVKDKPTAERFLSMNRGIDFGETVDATFLTSIYNAIKSEEFQVPVEEGSAELKLTFYYADLKGWLWKRGESSSKSWKRRWFVLNDNCLYYFNHPTDKNPRTIIPLENIQVTPGGKHPKYFIFLLKKSSSSSSTSGSSSNTSGTEFIKSCKRLSDGTMVLGRHSEFILGATNRDERDTWVQAITQNSSFDVYYTLVQEKKRNMLALQNKPILRSKKVVAKKGGIRKSQISLPTSRTEGSSPDQDAQQLFDTSLTDQVESSTEIDEEDVDDTQSHSDRCSCSSSHSHGGDEQENNGYKKSSLHEHFLSSSQPESAIKDDLDNPIIVITTEDNNLKCNNNNNSTTELTNCSQETTAEVDLPVNTTAELLSSVISSLETSSTLV